jgi:hypothetical protein
MRSRTSNWNSRRRRHSWRSARRQSNRSRLPARNLLHSRRYQPAPVSQTSRWSGVDRPSATRQRSCAMPPEILALVRRARHGSPVMIRSTDRRTDRATPFHCGSFHRLDRTIGGGGVDVVHKQSAGLMHRAQRLGP